jgi:ligand-binding sensor domain-containing protein
MKKLTYLLLVYMLLYISQTNAQVFTNYAVESTSTMLCSNYVYAIAIDSAGNKWFGTQGGVSKFDGTNWTTYTKEDGLVDNSVDAIAIDAEGNKWFGTYHGVSKFNGINWTTYDTLDGLVDNEVYAIAIDSEGNKWFGTYHGVSKFDDTTWTTYDTLGLITGDAEGNIWFATSYGVSKFDGDNWTTYDNYANDIAVDLDGNIWFGTRVGVSKFDGVNWTNYRFINNLDSNSYIRDMVIDKQGNKWFILNICSYLEDGWRPKHMGLGVLKFDNTNWTNYTTGGLPGNIINTIAIDAQGNKWFGVIKSNHPTGYLPAGISKFDDTTWTIYTTADGLAGNHVYAIAIDAEGNKWFGTDGGVSKFNNTTWTTYDTLGLITGDAEGNIWFATSYGVSKFDGTTWTTYDTLDGLLSCSVDAIAIDLEGNKWFGYGYEGKGVTKFDGINWTNYTIADGLADNIVYEIAIDAEGNKWFGYVGDGYHTNKGKGVTKFDGINWKTYTIADGLVDNRVDVIAIDAEGNKWFGCYGMYDWEQDKNIGGGISKFDGINWTTYTTEDGLASNHVNAIAIDAEGNKWFGCTESSIESNQSNNEGGVSKLSADSTGTIIKTIKENHLNFYPNPVQNVLHINLSGETGGLQIFDISGKCLLQKQITGNERTVDVSGLEEGIYIIKIIYDNKIFTGKVVKN